MGCRFTGALAYADDITLLAPCKSALSLMIDVCEQYAAEFDMLFNGSKSKLLFFKDRYACTITSGIMVNGEIVHISDNAVHLGHNISTSDRDSMILAAKRAFGRVITILYLILVIYIHYLKLVFLHHFVAVFMGHHCGC